MGEKVTTGVDPSLAENPAPRAGQSRYGWVIVGTAFLSMALVVGSRFSMGLFMPHMPASLGTSAANVAAAFALPMLIAAAMQPFAGVMIDRLGGRVVLVVGLAAAGLALVGTSFADAVWQVALLMGLLSSVAYAAVSPMSVASIVSGWFETNRGRALGVATSGTKVAMIALPPVLTTLIAVYDWRLAMMALGLVVLALIPVVLVLAKPAPGSAAARRTERRRVANGGAASDELNVPAASPTDLDLKRALRVPAFWLVAGALFANGFVMNLVFFHLPSYLLTLGYAEALAATGLSVLGGIGILGNILTGALSDSLGRRAVLMIMFGARCVATLVLVLAPGPATFLVFIAVIGFLGYGAIGVIGALGIDLFGRRNIGTILGTAYVFNQVGGAAGTYSGGLSLEWTGSFDAALWLAIVITALSILCVAAIGRRRKPTEPATV